MSKVHDNVIRDLLPLYIDNVCSEESSKLIENHLSSSAVLREEMNRMREELRIAGDSGKPDSKEAETIKRISAFWSRSKWKSFMKGAVLSVVVCGILLLGYIGLFQWNIIPVPSEVIAISDVGRLKNGKIAYHITLTDGYESNYAKFEMDDKGNFYIVPYRPIIKTRAKVEIATSYYANIGTEQFFYSEKFGQNAKIKAFYYGKPEDRVLVWKEGMEVPEASDKAEAWFQEP
ncbi:zf-HC2 domain-containing protein [Paenibacillus sp. DYY-L-2]|uniref:zf-HC2 domain-containing protein n=1 Tax=Paenibacillus sp. DYY-L-2 TaxID=3447013 RepID=UPI003F507B0A